MYLNSLFTLGTLLLISILILACILHIYNIRRIYIDLGNLGCHAAKSSFYKEITVSQGSNFIGLTFASWILLSVAIAFLYLLVPTILPYSYMQVAELASSSIGFLVLGILIFIMSGSTILLLDKLPENYRDFRFTELYSFYSISKRMKRIIGLTVLPLCVSVLLSAYLGTIYPELSISIELVSLTLVVISASIMVMPIFREASRGRA
jgi:hypothetical protein